MFVSKPVRPTSSRISDRAWMHLDEAETIVFVGHVAAVPGEGLLVEEDSGEMLTMENPAELLCDADPSALYEVTAKRVKHYLVAIQLRKIADPA